MRLLLVGQRSFGAAALNAIADAGHDVVGVFAPDPDDWVAQAATRLGVPWDVTPPDALSVKMAGADLIVAAHSHAYLGRKTRNATRLGAVGYHPSLLPRHRGRDAVHWTVHMRDPVAGGTVYWFDDNVDGGPIAAQRWCFVDPAWTHHDLWRERLFPMGVELLLQVLKDLDNGLVVAVPQEEQYASWEPSWDRPPLFRPELPELGAGPSGFEVTADRSRLQ